MVLFLDFDGVLHQPVKDVLFARVPAFEQALLLHPNLEIVISSSWRESHTLEQMRFFFSPSFRERIIDVTPVFEYQEVERADGCGVFLGCQGLRQKEIEQYMEQNHPPSTPWIALDDMPELFNGDNNLIYTPNGFDDSSIESLNHWVRAVQGKPTFC